MTIAALPRRVNTPVNSSSERARIGHNGGPTLDISWKAWVWRRAHAAAWKTPGREIVLLRTRRAEELGLSYRAYTSVLMDRGVRLTGFVLMTDKLPARYAETIGKKLARLTNCAMLFCGEDQSGWFDDLADAEANVVRAHAGPDSLREALRAAAKACATSPGAFFAIGWSAGDEALARSLGLSLFVWGDDYFGLTASAST